MKHPMCLPAIPVLCFLATISFLNPSSAQTVNCTTPTSQAEMTICAGRDYEAADAELNAAYKMARAAMKSYDAELPADRRDNPKALLEAQRAWIPYRDAACEAEGFPFQGGTIRPMIIAECLARLTRQRTDDLRTLAQN